MNREDISRWTKSILIALIVFSLFSFYLLERRGYYNLYIINKVFGSTAVVLAGMTLLIGPLSQKFSIFAKAINIKRHLGLLALGFGLAHITASIFFLSARFTFTWYIREAIPVAFGVFAILVWFYLASISQNNKIHQMGVELWQKHQSVGAKIAFLAIFLHLTIMKNQGWINWWQGKIKQTPELANPNFPPASLFVLFFMVGVIIYRLDLLKPFNSLFNRWMGGKEIK